MATLTGTALLDAMLAEQGVTISTIQYNVIAARFQQMIDAGVTSNLAFAARLAANPQFAESVPEGESTALYLSGVVGEQITIIEDGEGGPITFELTAATQAYEGEAAAFTVTASRAVEADTPVTLQLVAGDVSAADQGTATTNMNDFAGGAFNLKTATILAGQTSATLNVTALLDTITEFTETYSVIVTVGSDTWTETVNVLDGGGIAGQTFTLTTSIDQVDFSTSDQMQIDTVKGLINDDGTDDLDTFSNGDSITGNGKTIVQLSVVDEDGVDFVEMEGVDQINIKGAGETGTITLDASTYGSDISTITLGGADDLTVCWENLVFDSSESAEFSIDVGTTGKIYFDNSNAPVMYGDWFLSGCLTATDTGDGSSLTIGSVGLSATAGDDSLVDACLYIEETTTSADASIGDMNIGSINLTATGAGCVSVTHDICVEAINSGNATVGNITLGDISLAAGTDWAEYDLLVCALADDGTGTIGDISVGNISFLNTGSVSIDACAIGASGTSDSGDATIGNITIGNVSGSLSSTEGEWQGLYVCASADVDGTGTASVGNVTIGDFDFQNDDCYFSGCAVVEADNSGVGDATIGDITAGNINVTLADTSACFSWCHTIDACADEGNASIGNVAMGNITGILGEEGEISIVQDIYACASSGDAMVGDVTIGSIDLAMDSGASADICISACACANSGEANIGNIAIGDVNLTMGIDSTYTQCVSVTVCASASATASGLGDVSIGSVSASGSLALSADVHLYMSLQVDNGTIGNVTVGDVDLDLLSGASACYSMWAYSASSYGAINFGDVNIVADTIDYYLSLTADGDMANGVTIGDISLDGDDVQFHCICLTASNDMGDVTIGNINLDAATNLTLGTIHIEGTNSVGNVALGDITIDSPESDHLYVCIDTTNDIGDVTMGDVNISVAATATSAAGATVIHNDVTVTADIGSSADTVGSITVGDITLSADYSVTSGAATGDFGTAQAMFDLISDYTATSGATIGDIDITLSNAQTNATATLAGLAAGYVDVDVNDGDIIVGDITLTAVQGTVDVDSAVTSMFSATVSLDADAGDVTVGDITVVGGSVNTTSAVLDNFATLTSWLSTNGGTVTVGDIDYSGYAADASIDVSGYEGAANINAAQGDTTIIVNTTTNIITLGAGDDTVDYNADKDSGTTYADIDKISGFTSGSDQIDFSTDADITNFDVGGTVADYDAFLIAAQSAMSFDSDIDVFAMNDGSNVYVAVDSDDDASDTIDYVIELTGITSVTAGDFVV
jgi:hypothetical protein